MIRTRAEDRGRAHKGDGLSETKIFEGRVAQRREPACRPASGQLTEQVFVDSAPGPHPGLTARALGPISSRMYLLPGAGLLPQSTANACWPLLVQPPVRVHVGDPVAGESSTLAIPRAAAR